jgi:hypothetical protein
MVLNVYGSIEHYTRQHEHVGSDELNTLQLCMVCKDELLALFPFKVRRYDPMEKAVYHAPEFTQGEQAIEAHP